MTLPIIVYSEAQVDAQVAVAVTAERARLREAVEAMRAEYTCKCSGIGCHEAEAREICDRTLALLSPETP